MTVVRSLAGRAWRSPWPMRLVLSMLAVTLAGVLTWRVTAAEAAKKYDMPRNSAIEAKLGIRFTQAAVVADGGLVELRYTVLDTDKASAFQNDVHHPPVLKSDKRSGDALYRTALMKQGHNLRPGQSYYILYLNNHNAVRSGETLQIDAGGATMAQVPVR